MSDDRSQEKSEQATPQRRQTARGKGQVARSTELTSVVMLGGGLLVMVTALPYLMENAGDLVATMLRFAGEGPRAQDALGPVMRSAFATMFRILAPVLLVSVVAALGVNIAQVGFHVSATTLEPRLDKINPIEGFKRILGKRAMFELGKGIMKLVIVGVIAWVTYSSHLSELAATVFAVPGMMIPDAMRIGTDFLLRALVTLAALAAVDFAWQKYQFEKSIRMSFQDIKEELKESEGDPHLKARVRSIQRKLASQRMMDRVKDAALVITNPTHYAVALGYDEGEDAAPRVLAKGQGRIALRIRELARENGVTVVEKPALARLLFKECQLDQIIPASLYEAVAQVLAYVYSLKRRKKAR